MAYPVASLADGSILYSDGTKQAPASFPNQYSSPSLGTNAGQYVTNSTISAQNLTQPAGGDSNGGSSGGGTNTAPSSSEPVNQGPSEADLIREAYGGYTASLDDQFNQLSSFESQQRGYVEDQAGELGRQLTNARDRNVAGLDQSAVTANQNKAKTLRDVQQDLINALQAGQVYLGGMGAGSSSAVDRLSGALGKAANRRTTDVSNQFQGIMSDIDLQKQNLQSIYDDQQSQLNQWKNSQINNIATWIQQQRQSIMNTKGQVDAQMNMQILDAARQQLAQVDQQTAALNNNLQNWVAQKSNSIDQYVSQIQQLGQYDIPGYTYDQFSGQFRSNTPGIAARYFGTGQDDERTRV